MAINADWSIFKSEIDEEGQRVHIIETASARHCLDGDDAAILLDRLNGHLAPSAVSNDVEAHLEGVTR